MSTTIRELLEHVLGEIEHTAPTATLPLAAAAVIGHCGRALGELAYDGPAGLGYDGPAALGARRVHAAVTELAQACTAAASTWPANDVGLSEAFAGAAADAIARAGGPMLSAERWALAISVAEVTRRCADHAQTFPPCRGVPQLVAVYAAAAGVEQVAAKYPPGRFDDAALDTAIPSIRPPQHLTGPAAAADAARALAASVHSRTADRQLTMADVLACVAAAETATRRAVAVSQALEPAGEDQPTWAAAPAAWRAVHRACAPFDDGTKGRPPSTRVIAWAAQITRVLHTDQPDESNDLASAATAMRTVINHLPALAADIERAVNHWSHGNYLLARERRLASYEDCNHDAAHATDRVVFARGRDLQDLQLAVSDARQLSAHLAAELDRSSSSIGHQPEQGIAVRHVEATRSAGTSVLRVLAQRADAGAAATADRQQWSYVPRERHDRQEPASSGGHRDRWATETAGVLGRPVRDDPDWGVLQRTLDRAAATGYPVSDRLPLLARQAPLPERTPLLELSYRVMSDWPAAIPDPTSAAHLSGSRPRAASRRPEAIEPPASAPARRPSGPRP